jgi:DNA-binding Lrp family transcriptional regulator
MTKRPLDDLDRHLLALLQANAREPTASLARKLGISRTTVQDRINRLERERIIAGYTIRLSPDHERRMITAHVMMAVNPKLADRVVHALRALPEVRELHAVSGVYDLLALICAETTGGIDDVLDRIGQMPGIDRTTSSIILSTKMMR